MVQAVGGGQCFGQDGSQPGVVALGETGLQGKLETGEGVRSWWEALAVKSRSWRRSSERLYSISLLARLRAHLRRHAVAHPARDPVRLGDLVVDVAARRCALHGVEVPLRAKEFDLLAERVGEAVSREALMAEVWDENWFGSTKTLDVTMAGLRRRLTEAAEAGGRPARLPEITTLRGHGYRLDRQTDRSG